MNETTLVHRLLLAFTKAGARLFRNNSGIGWAGSPVYKVHKPELVQLNPGDVVVRHARPLHAGLCDGSSDAIGWQSIEITPAMVGGKLAVFVAVEAKSRFGRLTVEQAQFLGAVKSAGGIAIEARDVDTAVSELGASYKGG